MPVNRWKGSLMRKVSFLLLAAFLLFTVPSFAQDYAPFEIFGGYNFLRLNGVGENSISMNGWNMSFTGNLNSTLGIKAEIAGVYKNLKDDYLGGEYNVNGYSFMAGPQINGRFELFPSASSVFGHVLFGTERLGGEYFISTSYFAMALGGGIDWGNGRIGVRAPQIDYFPMRVNGSIMNNFRISAGIVIRAGN